MSTNAFNTLYEQVITRAEGWLDLLKTAWFEGCLTPDQKNLLETAV